MRKARKKFSKKPGKFYRLNHFITAHELRLVDDKGKQIGIVSKADALRMAKDRQCDVVEIAPTAKPPVAKLIDFKKFKYLEAKKEREDKKKQKNVGLKEIKMRPFIGDHDLETKLKQAREFLNNGNQLKISVVFRGREIIRKQFGFDLLSRINKKLPETKIARSPHFEGKVLVTILAPDKKK